MVFELGYPGGDMYRTILTTVAATALFLVGCGDDDATDAGGDDPTIGEVNDRGTETIEDGSVVVELVDFAFEPTFLEGGEDTVTVSLENTGTVAHTFTIDALEVDEVLDPGQQAEIDVELTEADEPVVFICRFHDGQGMRGAFGQDAADEARGGGGDGPYGY